MTRPHTILAALAGAIAGAAALIATGIAMGVQDDVATYDPHTGPNPIGYRGPTAHENLRPR